MLFKKRGKRVGPPPALRGKNGDQNADWDFLRIEFDAMLKGAIVERADGMVRQIGVTVGGSTRLVTSGDLVDRATYEALLNIGAIRPLVLPGGSQDHGEGTNLPPPPVVDVPEV